MKPKIFAAVIMLLLLTALALFHVPSTQAANRDLVQLQTQVQALQDQMTAMKTSFDERMGVMKALLELGDKQNGTQTLNELIARYPRSIEAAQARDRLRRLNGGPAASTARPRRTVR